MTDTTVAWRDRPPRGMYATISQHRCGWHIVVHQTGPNYNSLLRSTVVAKACVPFGLDEDHPTALKQLRALVVGLYEIEEGIEPECDRL